MNKKILLIVIAVLLGIVLIIFSLYWPPVSESDASGAFTKAEKYKQNTLQDGDIILNSELLKDSNLTKRTIVDLVQFGDFALYIKETFNQVWLPELTEFKGIPEISSAIEQINEFSTFIENNNTTVQKVVSTLIEFHIDKNKPVNADVESQLKQFYNYATQFLIRDSIFEATIGSIDIALKNDKNKVKHINALKDLKDRIVIDNFMYGISVGDTSKISFSSIQVINNPKNIVKLFAINSSENQKGVYAGGFTNAIGFAASFIKGIEIEGMPKDKVGMYQLVLGNALGGNGGNGAQALGGQGGNGGNGGLGNNNPILFMGAGNYFGFNQTNLGFVFNSELIEAQFGNTQKGLIPVGSISEFINSQNLKFVLNQDKSYQIDYTNANTINAINQFQLGLFNQDMKGIISWNFDNLNAISSHNQLGSAQ